MEWRIKVFNGSKGVLISQFDHTKEQPTHTHTETGKILYRNRSIFHSNGIKKKKEIEIGKYHNSTFNIACIDNATKIACLSLSSIISKVLVQANNIRQFRICIESLFVHTHTHTIERTQTINFLKLLFAVWDRNRLTKAHNFTVCSFVKIFFLFGSHSFHHRTQKPVL